MLLQKPLRKLVPPGFKPPRWMGALALVALLGVGGWGLWQTQARAPLVRIAERSMGSVQRLWQSVTSTQSAPPRDGRPSIKDLMAAEGLSESLSGLSEDEIDRLVAEAMAEMDAEAAAAAHANPGSKLAQSTVQSNPQEEDPGRRDRELEEILKAIRARREREQSRQAQEAMPGRAIASGSIEIASTAESPRAPRLPPMGLFGGSAGSTRSSSGTFISGSVGQQPKDPDRPAGPCTLPQLDPLMLASVTRFEGQPVTFSVSARGANRYEWRRDHQLISDTSKMQGATRETLQFIETQMIDVGIYRATAINECGSVQSEPMVLTLNRCKADYNNDGVIQPQDRVLFYSDWENGLPEADVNYDGGVDGDDSIFFEQIFTARSCR